MREYRNRICSAVLAAVCVIGTALIPSRAVHAEDVVDPIAVQKQAAYDAVPETNGLENWPQGPHVYANSAIVMEMNSGAILYGKKINDKHYPASITKLLTALVALENADPDDEVYFSEDSVSFLEYGDASIGMRPGEILSMNDALYGMLLASANEVSYAIAESVGKKMGGGFETFIQKMNERCEELGCTGSHWTNANGLHDENHYTTAHDMALIGSAVYQFDKFREVTQTLNYTIPPTNLVNESRTFQQNHKMLWVGAHYSYDYCTGGKTRYTDQAKTTLVTMADNADMQLVAVVLEDQGDVYVDTRAMFDYVYANFSKVFLNEHDKPDGVRKFKTEDAYVVLPKGIDVSSLEHEITITDRQNAAGKLTYLYKGQNVGTVEVKLTADYIKEETGYNIEPEMKSVGKKSTDKEEKNRDAYICKAVNSGSSFGNHFVGSSFQSAEISASEAKESKTACKKTQKGIRAPAVKYRADGRKCFPTTEQCRQEKKYPNKKPSGRRQKKRKLSQARQRRAVQINKFTVFAMSRRNHYAYEKGYIIKKEDE